MTEIPVDLMATGGRLIPPDQMPPKKTALVPPRAEAPAKDPVQEPVKDAAPPTPPEAVKCPYCGWDHSQDPCEPDAGDAFQFRDAVFSGTPYTKRIALYGTAAMAVRDLTADEETAAQAQALKMGIAQQASRGEMMEILTGIRMGVALVSVDVGTNQYRAEPIEDPFTADLEGRHKLVRTWCKSDTLYRALRWQYVRFHQQLSVLLSRAADRSFFSATGPRGVPPVSPPPA